MLGCTTMSIEVIDATEDHLPAIAAIYAKAAAETHVTFDVEGPSVEEWGKSWRPRAPAPRATSCSRRSRTAQCSATPRPSWFKERPGYFTTREVSAYVHEDHRGRGVGHALYAELLGRLDRCEGLRMAVGGVALPNDASDRPPSQARLHRGGHVRRRGGEVRAAVERAVVSAAVAGPAAFAAGLVRSRGLRPCDTRPHAISPGRAGRSPCRNSRNPHGARRFGCQARRPAPAAPASAARPGRRPRVARPARS